MAKRRGRSSALLCSTPSAAVKPLGRSAPRKPDQLERRRRRHTPRAAVERAHVEVARLYRSDGHHELIVPTLELDMQGAIALPMPFQAH